ncbi:MAG TPA: hypothetical protein VL172_02965, partial [Kofleriaceae bacterium]|nr:hypothetical protein [Kofleriaceae bacterium]
VESIRGMDFQTRQLLLALRSGYRPEIARALLLESMWQSTSSNPRRARKLLDRAIAVGAGEDDPYMKAMVHGALGMMAYFGGDVVGGVHHLSESEIALRAVPGHNWEYSTARLFQLFGLRFIGDFVTMRTKYEQYVVEAAHRGDRYLDSTMRRASVAMWLAEDDVDGAMRELERATWVAQSAGFHVQHFHELVAWGEIALYSGRVDPRARFAEMFERLDASMLLRVESIRVQDGYLRGRLALAGLLPAGDAIRYARKLAREHNHLARTWSLLLRAGTEAQAQRPDEAIAILTEAGAAAEAAGMRLTQAAARRLQAQLRGNEGEDEQALAATGEMGALGVRAPGRMTEMLIPIRRRF